MAINFFLPGINTNIVHFLQCMTAHDFCSSSSFDERGWLPTLNNSSLTYYLTFIVPLQTALHPPMVFRNIFQWLKKYNVIASNYKLASFHPCPV